MGSFVKGDVVVLEFPFSDLSGSKRRPALVLTELGGNDVILCMITTATRDADSIPLDDTHFDVGKLSQVSNIRPNRLFTADSTLVYYSAGHLKPTKTAEVVNKLIKILSR